MASINQDQGQVSYKVFISIQEKKHWKYNSLWCFLSVSSLDFQEKQLYPISFGDEASQIKSSWLKLNSNEFGLWLSYNSDFKVGQSISIFDGFQSSFVQMDWIFIHFLIKLVQFQIKRDGF